MLQSASNTQVGEASVTIQGLPENQANIIVLDDESELRQMLQHYLQAQGFRVQAIADSARLDVLLARSPGIYLSSI
ncbi:hypothetical protein ABC733_05485 [Mangrovibacter sp. SLW1]